MSTLTKIDSNNTSIRYCKELTIGVLDVAANQVWYPLEPNTYSNYGGQIKTVARQPISASRQIRKGVVTDIDAAGGINTDITQTNLQDLLQGFFFANAIQQPSNHGMNTAAVPITSVVASGSLIEAASGLAVFKTGFLIYTSGFANNSNNGLHVISTGNVSAQIAVVETLVNETVSGYSPTVDVCGFQGASGDLTITQGGGSFPVLGSTTLDFTTLNLVPGQWIYIGGDTTATHFATAANNGFARVLSVTTHAITLDRTQNTMVTDTGTSKTIQIFFGTVFQNQQGTNIIRRTYTLERILGAYNTSSPSSQQAEYITGAVPNEFSLNVATAAKLTADITFAGLSVNTIDENVSGANTLLSKVSGATAPAIVSGNAFNTTSNVPRINLSIYTAGTSNPTTLFTFVENMTVTIKNNLKANKAIGVLGAFEETAGFFQISGKMSVYFAEVEVISQLLNNANFCLDAHFVENNAGFTVDLPLLTLGDGRPDVKINEPVMLPLNFDGASASPLNSNLNISATIEFYPYLPTAA